MTMMSTFSTPVRFLKWIWDYLPGLTGYRLITKSPNSIKALICVTCVLTGTYTSEIHNCSKRFVFQQQCFLKDVCQHIPVLTDSNKATSMLKHTQLATVACFKTQLAHLNQTHQPKSANPNNPGNSLCIYIKFTAFPAAGGS